MKQHGYGRDTELNVRIALTSFFLLLIYVAFAGLLFWAGIPPIFIFVMGVILATLQYYGSDKLVLMTTGARVVGPNEEPKLHGMVERLAAMADMPKPKKLAIMNTHVPNAFATGRNPKNSIVTVTTGLMSRLDEKEQEAVLAHELSHVKNRDVMVITWAGLIVIMSGYLLQLLFWISLFGGFGGGNRREGGSNSMIIALGLYVGTITIYFMSQLLILSLSRYREYAADRSGAILTGAPLQLASALNKISDDMYRIPEKDLRQVEHANAFFIINAIKGNATARLLSSHPPVEKRIERLREMQRQMEGGS